MKKGFSIIMAFVTVMTMLFSGVTFADDTNENTESKTKESNFTNLIVFARFLDEDEFIDFASETELGIEQFSTPFASQYVGEGLYMKFMKQTYREEDLPCIPTEKCVVIDTRK